ncbi:MAG: hypothetical protein HY243_10215 [Proteobacteria bacterium]|nr:hypothetical protein [Pseudomonadota bacterium]
MLSSNAIYLVAIGLAVLSAASMVYVGLYQSRVVEHLWCPVFGDGCEVVADAPFAKPFGVPDGYIAAVLYSAVALLLLGPVRSNWDWSLLLILAIAALLANIQGIRDMAKLGRYCFYCVLTSMLSPALLAAIWFLR